jgi:CRP-like cAMP-binding protein
VVSSLGNPGDYIGEMSTLLKVPRTATIVAVVESQVLRIPADKVLDFMQHSPQLGLKLATILAQRLKGMNDNYVKLKEKVAGIQNGFLDNLEAFLKAMEQKIADNPQAIDSRVSKWFLSTFSKVRKQLKLPDLKSSQDSDCY